MRKLSGEYGSVERNEVSRMKRRFRNVAAAVNRISTAQEQAARDAERIGNQVGRTLFSTAGNRPAPSYLVNKRVDFLMHFSTDTNRLSCWTGSAWKTVTLT